MEDNTQPILPWDNTKLEQLLRELIAHGTEAIKIDFKSELEIASDEQRAEVLKDITAIANSYDDSYGDHGFIIYGVKTSGIVGVSSTEKDADKLKNTIDQLLREYISPMPLAYVTSFTEPAGERWGAVVIVPRNNKPHMFYKDLFCQDRSKSRKKGEWFVRKGATNSPGLPEDLARITQRQLEIEVGPLKEGIRNLQDRTRKMEDLYESSLFKVVTHAVSLMSEGTDTNLEESKVEQEGVPAAPLTRQKFPLAHAKDGPARFRASGDALGFEDDTFGENEREIFLSKGPAMWLRVMPAMNPQREWPTRELRRLALDKSHLLPLIHPAGGYSYLRATDGEGMYRANGDKPDTGPIEVDSVAFAFKTGEIWSIETALLSWETGNLYSTEIEKAFVQSLGNYGLFLKELGIETPFHWKAGLVGVKGRHLQYPAAPGRQWIRDQGPICAADLIEAEGELEDDQSPSTALLPFFEKIFEECGRERPDYLPR